MDPSTLLDFATLAEAVYTPHQAPAGWHILDEATTCHGAAFQKEAGGNVVVAFRGTQNVQDILADIDILLNHEDALFPAAFAFYARTKQSLKHAITDIGLTGHSLGGAMAAFCAFYARYTRFCPRARACVFNALPIEALIAHYFPDSHIIKGADFVENYDDAYDIVSHIFNKHQLGTTYIVPGESCSPFGLFCPLKHHSIHFMKEDLDHFYDHS